MNSVILGILLLLNIAVGFICVYSFCKKILLSFSTSVLVQITEYMLLALVGAKFDFYSAKWFLLISLLINVFGGCLVAKRVIKFIKDIKSGSGSKKPSFLPLPYALCLFVVICSMFAYNGLFGMGQDQGVYQVKALALAEGNVSNELILDSESEVLRTTVGFDDEGEFNAYNKKFFDDQKGFNEIRLSGGAHGLKAVFHGTTAYPALLALDIELFGIGGMMFINYVLTLIAFSFILEIVTLLDFNRVLGSVCLIVGVLSPTTIWSSKASLTESVQFPLTAAIILGFVMASCYAMKVSAANGVGNGVVENKCLSRLGLFIVTVAGIGFAVLHLSAFYILPIVGVLLVVHYLRSSDYWALICNQVITAIYLVAFNVETKLYKQYVYGNLTLEINRMIGKNLTDAQCFKIVYALAIGMSLFTLVFLIPVIRKIGRKFLDTILYPIVLVGVGGVCGAKILLYVISYSKQVDFPHAISSLSLFGIAVSSGAVLLPVALFLGVWFIRKFMKDSRYEVVMIAFVYFIIFLTSFVHPVTPHYYYYSRYFAPVVFLVPLVVSIIADKYMKKKIFGYIIGGIAVAVILPYIMFVSSIADDTNLKCRELENYSKLFKKGDAVVFADDTASKVLMLPTKYTTDADVYLNIVDGWELLDHYENVYYVTYNEQNVSNSTNIGTLVDSVDITIESDPQLPHRAFFPLFDYIVYDSAIRVYKFDPYFFDMNEIVFDGFFDYEGNLIWSSDDSSSMTFNVDDFSYGNLYIILSDANNLIPDGHRNCSFKMTVNGELYTNYMFSKVGDMIVIPMNELQAGENVIEFDYKTWSVKEAYEDTEDERELGFAIKAVYAQ